MIDLYCERLSSNFWAEPINALTNVVFFIAAWSVWRLGRRIEKIAYSIYLLIGVMVAIGIGSFLFHTYATNWARFLDVLPILLFQLLFMWVYIREVVQLRLIYATGLFMVYIFFAFLGRQFPYLLNDSLSYAPAFFLLLGLGTYHFLLKQRERFLLLAALVVFSLALLFRTVDSVICPYFPSGTHFLWHIFNGGLVYLLMRALMLNLTHNVKIT